MDTLAAEVRRLRMIVLDTPRLHIKDLMQRYRKGKSTIYRWLEKGILPKPIRLGGPLWKECDLQACERAGQLPRPVWT